MNTFFTFILGVLVGWLVEWIIDFFYWRRRWIERDTSQAYNRPLETKPDEDFGQKSTAVIAPDNLKVIKGIGEVIERKLNDAGIYTFEDLGNLSIDKLRQILGKTIERLADEESLLNQARDLARRKNR